MSSYGQMTSYQPITVVRRVRRRKRGFAPLWVSLFTVALLLLLADRAAASIVTQKLQGHMTNELAAHDVGFDSASVHIAGYPFLNQVASGHFDEITIDLDNVRSLKPALADKQATVPHLRVVATGVNGDPRQLVRGKGTVIADRVVGTTVVPFQTVTILLADAFGTNSVTGTVISGLKFADKNGTLHAIAETSLVGVTVGIDAAVQLTIDNGVLRAQLHDFSVTGLSRTPLVDQFIAGFRTQPFEARLPKLPFSMTLNEVRSQPDGLAITATAQKVPLAA